MLDGANTNSDNTELSGEIFITNAANTASLITSVRQEVSIFVSFAMEGLHQWKDCPLEEVKYLRDMHRHMFHFEIEKKSILNDDREIEIIMFKQSVQKYLGDKYQKNSSVLEFGNMSCEMIAEDIASEFDCSVVKVTEDNENGAKIYRQRINKDW